MRASESNEPVVVKNPEILGGTPVFRGTRVPFQTLVEYLEAGQTLDEFLDDFPHRDTRRCHPISGTRKRPCDRAITMKVLLDECLRRKLKRALAGHDYQTVPEAGLAGLKNGELLDRAVLMGFEVFIILDRGVEYQQRLEARELCVLY